MLHHLIPTVFYADVSIGLDLFVDGIGMQIQHQDDDLVVAAREGAKVYLVQDAQHAALDRPEIGIETDDIEAVWVDVNARRPDLLHPRLPRVVRREWGAREFALLDATTVCVVFRDWS